MSWLSKFMNPQKGYESGQNELNKYYNQSQGYLNPYNQNGQNAYGGLNDAMNKLLNPQQLQDEWSKGYETSDAAKQDIADAQRYGQDAASSMGLNGSSAALNAIQGGASNIGAHDKQQYMNDLMQKYMTGTGIGQNIYGVGAGAAGQMSQNANNMGQNSAGMAYNQENAQGDLFSKLIGSFMGAAGTAMGAAGGPQAAAAGGQMGSSLRGGSGGGGWNIGGR